MTAAIRTSLTFPACARRAGHALSGPPAPLGREDEDEDEDAGADAGGPAALVTPRLGAPGVATGSICFSLLSDSFRVFNHNSAGLINDRYEKQLLPARRAGFFI